MLDEEGNLMYQFKDGECGVYSSFEAIENCFCYKATGTDGLIEILKQRKCK